MPKVKLIRANSGACEDCPHGTVKVQGASKKHARTPKSSAQNAVCRAFSRSVFRPHMIHATDKIPVAMDDKTLRVHISALSEVVRPAGANTK